MSNPKDGGEYLVRLDRLERWTQRLTLLVILSTAIVFANFSLTFVQLLPPSENAAIFKENPAQRQAEAQPLEFPVQQRTPHIG